MALISEGRYRQFEHNVIQSLETIKTKLQETSTNLDEIVDTVAEASEAAADAKSSATESAEAAAASETAAGESQTAAEAAQEAAEAAAETAATDASALAIAAIEARAAEIEADWPADYSDLTDDVTDLKGAFETNKLAEQKDVNTILGLRTSTLNTFDLYNPNIVLGKRVQGTGTLLTSETWFTSGFIPCDGKSTAYMTQINSNGVFIGINSTNFGHIEQYDENKAFISNTYQTSANSIAINENAKYLRFSNVLTQYQEAIAGTRLICVSFDAYPTDKAETEPYYWSIMATKAELQTVDDKTTANQTAIAEMHSTLHIPLISPSNKLDKSKITANSVLDNYGSTSYAADYYTTDFIPVEQFDIIYLSGINSSGTLYGITGFNIFIIVCYAEDKTTVTEYSANYRNGYQITALGTKYVRMTIANSTLDWTYTCITINEKPTRATMIDYLAPYYAPNGADDNTKRSRKTVWLGTSIPTYGYPQLLGRTAGATVYNEAIGESCIAKGKESLITTANICGVRKLGGIYSLTQTRSEKETLIANWATIATEISASATLTDDQKRICRMSSYEIILDPYLTGEDPTAVTFDADTPYPVGTLVKYDGKLYVLRGDHAAGAAWSWSTASGAKPLDVPHAQKAGMIVLNHGYNDQGGDLLCGDDVYNVYTLEGAYNWTIKHILDIVPDMPIVIFGHYSDFSYEDAEQALVNVAERWNIPYYKLYEDLGWSTQTITTAKKMSTTGEWETITATDMSVRDMWLGDGVHPVGDASKRIAKVAGPVFRNWIDMWI